MCTILIYVALVSALCPETSSTKNKHSNNVAKMIQVRQTNPSDKTVEESVCRGDMYLDSFEALQVSLGFEG